MCGFFVIVFCVLGCDGFLLGFDGLLEGVVVVFLVCDVGVLVMVCVVWSLYALWVG